MSVIRHIFWQRKLLPKYLSFAGELMLETENDTFPSQFFGILPFTHTVITLLMQNLCVTQQLLQGKSTVLLLNT